MDNLNDLRFFLCVAEQQSFTRAAAQLGVSPSAVSHTMKNLEQRLGVKLLHRTTRSVSLSQAGERLVQELTPLMAQIQHSLNGLGEYSGQLKGQLRINATESAFLCLWDKFQQFMQRYPEIELELIADNRMIDIVAERFDMGIRLGDDIAKDMIAVRIAEDMQMVVVASPDYLAKQGTPQTPHDLAQHQMLGLRLPTYGGLLAWEFMDPMDNHRVVKVQTHGHFTSNNSNVLRLAALDGHGLLWIPLVHATTYLQKGDWVEVLADWRMVYPGYHLYYPHRRADDALFSAFVEAMRYQR